MPRHPTQPGSAVPNFELGDAVRAEAVEEQHAGKGVSCSLALCGLGRGPDVAAVVLCGAPDVPGYTSKLRAAGVGYPVVFGAPFPTRRHVAPRADWG